MNRLYQKNELLFAILWIVVYVVSLSVADDLSAQIGVHKLITTLVCGLLTGILVIWMKKNQLFSQYGLCKPEMAPKQLLYYIPLVILASATS